MERLVYLDVISSLVIHLRFDVIVRRGKSEAYVAATPQRLSNSLLGVLDCT